MPISDITNPAVIIFLIENYEKENRIRLNWINKNREKVELAATLQRESTNYRSKDVIASTMLGCMATTTRDHITAGFNKRKKPIRDGPVIGSKKLRHGHSLVDIGVGDPKEDPRLDPEKTKVSSEPIMRPVKPEITEVLYKSKPEFGNKVYLRQRSKSLPENRYYLPECSSWEYGWRIKDSSKLHGPQYGRCWHLTRTLKNRVGQQPNPSYYSECDE